MDTLGLCILGTEGEANEVGKKEEKITTRFIPRELVMLRLLPTSSKYVTHI